MRSCFSVQQFESYHQNDFRSISNSPKVNAIFLKASKLSNIYVQNFPKKYPNLSQKKKNLNFPLVVNDIKI